MYYVNNPATGKVSWKISGGLNGGRLGFGLGVLLGGFFQWSLLNPGASAAAIGLASTELALLAVGLTSFFATLELMERIRGEGSTFACFSSPDISQKNGT